MFIDWRQKKLKQREEVKRQIDNEPIFKPIFKETEPSITVSLESHNIQTSKKISGVRLEKDHSRSFV